MRGMCHLFPTFYSLLLLFILIIFDTARSDTLHSEDRPFPESEGCTARFILPNKPFFVVWNEPSGGCDRHGFHFNFSGFDIIANTKDSFIGNEITLFYGLGVWPHYQRGSPINGGIPQLANVGEHFQKVAEVAKQYIPLANFTGLAVIDFESWRPLLPLNFDSLKIYITKSYELVQKQHPTWKNRTRIKEVAETEFDAAARIFLQGTLQEARQLRLSGHWGYYGYPRCWGHTSTYDCSKNAQNINDKFGWLFSTSTGLYPRIYTNQKASVANRRLYVHQQVNETLRVQAKWAGLATPIMPYGLCQNGPYGLFNKTDLDATLKVAADVGASGIVLWGSSSNFHARNECVVLQKYINEILGPYVNSLTAFTQSCSTTLCSGHGRCVRKDYEQITQKVLRQNGKRKCQKDRKEYEYTEEALSFKEDDGDNRSTGTNKSKNPDPYANYVCRCLAGWTGPHCKTPG